MAFDYKKEYREFYLPPRTPVLAEIPAMRFAAVRGRGDPNDPGGTYQQAIALLYGLSYTVKMSKKGDHRIEGYFDYVVPPLEGFWWQQDRDGVDFTRKDLFEWISLIRLPDFVREAEFRWAREEAARKKGRDFSPVELLEYREGLTVQCMHVGPYDDEPATIQAMLAFAEAQGCAPDMTSGRYHHEIYLSDARRVAPEQRKTVLRIPLRRLGAK